MAPRDDLVGRLQQFERALASVEPSARLDARLRAELQGRRAPAEIPLARAWRPLLLAAMAAGVAIAVGGSERGERDLPAREAARSASVEGDPRDAEAGVEIAPDRAPPQPDRAAPTRRPPALIAPARTLPIAPLAVPRSPEERALDEAPALRPESRPRRRNVDEEAPAPPQQPPRARDGAAPLFGGRTDEPSRPAPSLQPRGAAVDAERAEPGKAAPAAESESEGAGCASPEALKEAAIADCDEQGLELGTIDYVDPCPAGFRRAEHACEAPESQDAGCFSGSVGDGVTCRDPGELKSSAAALCAERGLMLSAFDYTNAACGAKTTEASFACCPAEAPPAEPPTDSPEPTEPMPDSCVSGDIGDGTCQDTSALKRAAIAACAALEIPFFTVYLEADTCGGGLVAAGQYVCCDPATGP